MISTGNSMLGPITTVNGIRGFVNAVTAIANDASEFLAVVVKTSRAYSEYLRLNKYATKVVKIKIEIKKTKPGNIILITMVGFLNKIFPWEANIEIITIIKIIVLKYDILYLLEKSSTFCLFLIKINLINLESKNGKSKYINTL